MFSMQKVTMFDKMNADSLDAVIEMIEEVLDVEITEVKKGKTHQNSAKISCICTSIWALLLSFFFLFHF